MQLISEADQRKIKVWLMNINESSTQKLAFSSFVASYVL
jgi:hypothetical protein